MQEQRRTTAQKCLDAAYDNTMDFPSIVSTLISAGFESYEVDYRRDTAIYYHSDGAFIQLDTRPSTTFVAATFDAQGVEQAVREAQKKTAGYTYAGFCSKVKASGCAGYMVSFLGKRVVYFGRTAETHVEHFPSK